MAPEVFNNWRPVKPGQKQRRMGYGKAADVYSWGIIACQLATGRITPYGDLGRNGDVSVFTFLESVQKGRRPNMDGIPPLLQELITRCVHPIPKMRCNAGDIGKLLNIPGLLEQQTKQNAEATVILEKTVSEIQSRGNLASSTSSENVKPALMMSIHSKLTVEQNADESDTSRTDESEHEPPVSSTSLDVVDNVSSSQIASLPTPPSNKKGNPQIVATKTEDGSHSPKAETDDGALEPLSSRFSSVKSNSSDWDVDLR